MAAGVDLLGSSDVQYPQRLPNLYVAGSITSANGTTPVTCFTAPALQGYYIQELGMQLSPNSIIAAAGTVNLFFADSNFGTFFNLVWFIPQNAPIPQQQSINRQTNGPGFYWSSKVPATSVTFNTDTALTGGSVRWFIRYGITKYFG